MDRPDSNPAPPSLPDYLAPGLALVFVGINPGLHSARVSHYFATPANRFWRAFNAAQFIEGDYGPEDDHLLLQHGIGFTDVVKRPTAGVAQLTTRDFRHGAPLLREKLIRYQPKVVCFHGVTAYSSYLRFAEGERAHPDLSLQPATIGRSLVFVVPNPSPANAAFSLPVLIEWYVRLKELTLGKPADG